MNTKSIITLIASSFMLLACANASHYPITGQPVGANDHVRYIVAAEVTPR